jgi:hypothetical protein
VDHLPPITSLLRSILARPELAKYIRDVKLGGELISRHPGHSAFIRHPKFVRIPVSEVDLKGPITFVEALQIPDDGFWIQELRAGSMDAFVAVFLSQLWNLRRLEICGLFTRETMLLGTVFWSALCEPLERGLPTFQHLEEVSFSRRWVLVNHRFEIARNTHDLLPFFYLPAVKRMTLWLDNPDSCRSPVTVGWPTAQPPKASTLKSLELFNMREQHLGSVLSAAIGLESLRWSVHHDRDIEDQIVKPIFDLDQIALVVSHVRNTLRHLKISAESATSTQDIEEPVVTIKGSMKLIASFDALRTLQLPLPFLAGSISPANWRPFGDSLPRNIEHLTVATDLSEQPAYELTGNFGTMGAALIDLVRSWLRDWRDFTPHLRLFRLMVDYVDPWEWTVQMRDEVLELGLEAGIRIEVTESEAFLLGRSRHDNRRSRV